MICDDLTQEEVLEAYLIYASLHGFCQDVNTVRQKVHDYVENNVPDATIDDAIMAFLDDAIVAPPDVILPQWGCSRLYEIYEYVTGEVRHQTCESWFQNGCQFPEQNPPLLAHFWTELAIDEGSVSLDEGDRLRLMLTSDQQVTHVLHRQHGLIGRLPVALSQELNKGKLRERKFLPLVDHDRPAEQESTVKATTTVQPNAGRRMYRLLVVTADESVEVAEIVEYAAKAFHATRTKC